MRFLNRIIQTMSGKKKSENLKKCKVLLNVLQKRHEEGKFDVKLEPSVVQKILCLGDQKKFQKLIENNFDYFKLIVEFLYRNRNIDVYQKLIHVIFYQAIFLKKWNAIKYCAEDLKIDLAIFDPVTLSFSPKKTFKHPLTISRDPEILNYLQPRYLDACAEYKKNLSTPPRTDLSEIDELEIAYYDSLIQYFDLNLGDCKALSNYWEKIQTIGYDQNEAAKWFYKLSYEIDKNSQEISKERWGFLKKMERERSIDLSHCLTRVSLNQLVEEELLTNEDYINLMKKVMYNEKLEKIKESISRDYSVCSGSTTTHYYKLNLSDQELCDEDIPYILWLFSKNPEIKKVNLSFNHLRDEKGLLRQYLSKNKDIKINLRNNCFEREVCQDLNKYLKKNYKLPLISSSCIVNGVLKLSNMQLTDSFIEDICSYLVNQENEEIHTINLSGNLITDEGACKLAEFLSKNGKITVLDISLNKIGIVGLDALVNVPSLKGLSAESNDAFNIYAEGQDWFVYFMGLFKPKAEDGTVFDEQKHNHGHCSGVVRTLFKIINNKDPDYKELVRFNLAFQRLYDAFRVVGELTRREILNSDYDSRYENLGLEHLLEDNKFLSIYSRTLQDLKDVLFKDEETKKYIEGILDLIFKYQCGMPLKGDKIRLNEIGDKETLRKKLIEINSSAKNKGSFFSIDFVGNNHVVSLTYNPILDQWDFTDANALPSRNVSISYGDIFGEGISDLIFDALKFENRPAISSQNPICPTVRFDPTKKETISALFSNWKSSAPILSGNSLPEEEYTYGDFIKETFELIPLYLCVDFAKFLINKIKQLTKSVDLNSPQTFFSSKHQKTKASEESMSQAVKIAPAIG